ncbi:unnamed protein product [Echinostoma caproni]|uniref:XRN2-binding (XTBD) domain-containing protein n=1 Tax=Echinostoma caproni TaxID=27848 RepID=A0A183A259_9TREM|nr:unnamed protein product [Echinostoma caproni]
MVEIDEFRKHHENPTEWRIRRVFLEKNLKLLPLERLECLSHCFINVELYGNAYPDKVMQERWNFGFYVPEQVVEVSTIQYWSATFESKSALCNTTPEAITLRAII